MTRKKVSSATAPELVDVYRVKGADKILFRLLSEREECVNISHRRMPTWSEHQRFVAGRPYKAWYLIRTAEGDDAGAVYLSKNDEIGLFIFKASRGRGLGGAALEALLAKHCEVKRFLANVSPQNPASSRFFKQFRFKHIQNTYAFTR